MNEHEESTVKGPRKVLKIVLPVIALAVGVLIAFSLIKTKPKATRKPPVRHARLVEVQKVTFGPERAVIHAMGTVLPAVETELRPRVSGEIIEVADEFVPGGRFKKGEVVVTIDPADYDLALKQRRSDLAKAEGALSLELGQQSVAESEFELLGETVSKEDEDLVLRKPQLAQAQASVEAAQAAVEQAELNIERTHVRAPFNGVVRSREADMGMQVSASATIATLTGTDAYWVEAALPVSQIKWIKIPVDTDDEGSRARVSNSSAWGEGVYREGRVIRLLNALEEEGRMARLLVQIDDPLSLTRLSEGFPRMILGEYVRVEIEGVEMESVAELSRSLFRDGDVLWVRDGEGRLEVRPAEILFRGQDHLYVAGNLEPGEEVVATDLSSPVAGMPLRTADSEESR